jgi:CRISPR-associated endoribonuclease Cas6
LTLFGRANHYLAYVAHALKVSAGKGIQYLGPMELRSILQEQESGNESWHEILESGTRLLPLPLRSIAVPAVPQRVRIQLLTPLRLRHREQYLTSEAFTFADFFKSLLGRVSSIQYFHTETPLLADFAGLVAQSKNVELIAPNLRWTDWTRYSSRQKQKLQMGGLMGSFELSLARDDYFWPFIWIGQWLHTGKGTSMGLGQYRIESLEVSE